MNIEGGGPRPTAYDEGALMTSQSPRRFHEQGFPLDRSEGNTSPGLTRIVRSDSCGGGVFRPSMWASKA